MIHFNPTTRTFNLQLRTSYYAFQGLTDEQLRRINTHVGRCQTMLRGGHHVADIAVVYPVESIWPRFVPAHRPSHHLRVRVEDELVRVEAVSLVRGIRPVHAIPVELPGVDVGQVPVPHHVGLFRQRDRQGLDVVGRRIEQAELDPCGVLGKDREIDADPIPGCAERIGSARPDAEARSRHNRPW